jgi:outer membrane protein assembly factor BamB
MTMGRSSVYVLLLAGVAGCNRGAAPPETVTPAAAAPTEAPATRGATAAPKPPDGEDVLALMNEMNGPSYGRPAAVFRPGHVTPRTAPSAKVTASGFEIQFPSRAPIATPAVYDGRVYVSGGFRSREFYAFAAATGAPTWGIGLDDDGPSTSACADGVCAFNTESCTIFTVDARTGAQLWSWWLGDPLTSAPTIAGGMVFTSYPVANVEGGARPPGATHALIALDLKSGAVRWQRWLDSDVMSSPVVAGEFVYVTTFAGTVMKLVPATGEARYAVRARATSAPTVQFVAGKESMFYTRRGAAADETAGAAEMIVRTDDNHPKTRYTAKTKKADYIDKTTQESSARAAKGKSDDASNGFAGGAPSSANAGAASDNVGVSSVSTMQAFQGSRVLRVGSANVSTMGDEIVATDAETGKDLWTVELDGDVARDGGHLGTAPLAAGGRVLVATIRGDLLELDARTGALLRRYTIGSPVRSQPVVAAGWIYVGTDDGRLVAIDTGDRTLTGWPMWGGGPARTGVVDPR